MDLTLLYGPILKITFIAIALFTLERLMMRHDKKSGVPYADILEIIKSNPVATAIYYGILYFTVAYLLAAAIL